MKHYTNVVPASLYSKLLEKGMPELLETYAEVFDWLLSKGISINIYPCIGREGMWRYECFGERILVSTRAKGWIESAIDAICTTIKQMI